MEIESEQIGKFNPTFKQQAINLVTIKKYTITEAANAVGISEDIMMKWVLDQKKELIKMHKKIRNTIYK